MIDKNIVFQDSYCWSDQESDSPGVIGAGSLNTDSVPMPPHVPDDGWHGTDDAWTMTLQRALHDDAAIS
ncbi:hypothetical protein C3432_14315 [Citrobacter amalonaticus]|uniref:Uncharacterized protein n=1 Tax=Citrobacter amalonaticus TaxID=35703 RepID=A0A2S4RWC1_CITAM|nr:hypothetical protein C3432_14315 [Citrobacter amalonaticus]POT75107.1 hypothetical protein C3436_14785 [Citrobacter amalonaticus]POU64636.1 hypothetical protein C3430_15805 [Citrobacter amalonaticus]POV04472.1 hypothetical protein C3424_15125 [Citrobacter amalonaticus]